MDRSEAMLEQFSSLPLFGENSSELIKQFIRTNEIPKADCGKRRGHQVGQIASGLGDSRYFAGNRLTARSVDRALELISELIVATPGGLGGDLQSHRVERGVFAVPVAAHESLDVLPGPGHDSPPS